MFRPTANATQAAEHCRPHCVRLIYKWKSNGLPKDRNALCFTLYSTIIYLLQYHSMCKHSYFKYKKWYAIKQTEHFPLKISGRYKTEKQLRAYKDWDSWEMWGSLACSTLNMKKLRPIENSGTTGPTTRRQSQAVQYSVFIIIVRFTFNHHGIRILASWWRMDSKSNITFVTFIDGIDNCLHQASSHL